MFSTVLFLGFQMINQNAFVAMGNTRYSFLFGIMRKVLILVPLALILPHFIGVWGIYAAEAVSNPLTTIITFAVFERYMGTLKEKMLYESVLRWENAPEIIPVHFFACAVRRQNGLRYLP